MNIVMLAVVGCLACATASAQSRPAVFSDLPAQLLGNPAPAFVAERESEAQGVVFVLDARSEDSVALVDGIVGAGYLGEGATIVVLGPPSSWNAWRRYRNALPEARWAGGATVEVMRHIGASALPAIYGVDHLGAPMWLAPGRPAEAADLILRILDWIATPENVASRASSDGAEQSNLTEAQADGEQARHQHTAIGKTQ